MASIRNVAVTTNAGRKDRVRIGEIGDEWRNNGELVAWYYKSHSEKGIDVLGNQKSHEQGRAREG
jgi:hypothetical protein